MNLNQRIGEGTACVQQCDGSMGIGAGVEDHAATLDTGFLYPIHQSALMIGLLERDSEPMRLCSRSYGFLDIV